MLTHVAGDEERLAHIAWITPTVTEPDEVWVWQPADSRKRALRTAMQGYLKWLQADPQTSPELFVVGTERLPTGDLRLRTWFTAEEGEAYVKRLQARKGRRIHPSGGERRSERK